MAVKIYKTASSVNEGSATTFYASGFTNTTDKTFTYTLSTGTTNVAGYADVKGAASTSTGTVNITNGVAVIPLTLAADLTTEGTETLTLSYAANAVTNSLGVPIVSAASTAAGESASITVYDTSTASPSKIIPSAATVNEGGNVTFNINAADGTYTYSLPTANTGGVSGIADYTVTTNANVVAGVTADVGTVKVVNGLASIVVAAKADATTDGAETLTLSLGTFKSPAASTFTSITAITETVTIIDTSIAPTNKLLPSVASINEGGTVMFNLTNAAVGTYSYSLFNKTSGTSDMASTDATITGGTFASNKITGTVIVGSTGSVSIPVTLKSDGLTDGLETLTLALTGTLGAAAIASTTTPASVVVNDTSNAIPTLSPAATSVNEGGSAVFTLNNMPVGAVGGTTYTYVLSGSGTGSIGTAPAVTGLNATHAGTTTVALADVTLANVTGATSVASAIAAASAGVTAAVAVGDIQGTITVPAGKTSATLTVPLNADRVTETGGEMLTMTMDISGISAAVLVNDSSKDYAYSLNPSTAAVNEGSSVVFSITDGKPGATVSYKLVTVTASGIYGAADASDFTAAQGTVTTAGTALTGAFPLAVGSSVVIGQDGKASFSIFTRFDGAKDGSSVTQSEKFAVELYDSTTAITVVGTNTVIINDTSIA